MNLRSDFRARHHHAGGAGESGGYPRVAGLTMLILLAALPSKAVEDSGLQFQKRVEPILDRYCSDCHMDGERKGEVDFDEVKAAVGMGKNHDLWLKVLKNVRAGLMPPTKKPRPAADEMKSLETWIKYRAFGINAKDPDPGRITVRRLNRVEYRNTVRDLLGIDFNTEKAFPPDDSGHGFDNIADVLTLSPLLLEKYLAAAETIVSQARTAARNSPTTGHGMADRLFPNSIPANPLARRWYAERVLRSFAERAFRRPVDEDTLRRLLALAVPSSAEPVPSLDRFHAGMTRAMVAVLASPRFLFRDEVARDSWAEAPEVPPGGGKRFPMRLIPPNQGTVSRVEAPAPSEGKRSVLIDEYGLASRLSYFLWSSMPDDELSRLARKGNLRRNLAEQVKRMLVDRRSEALVQNFGGQWLQSRDIEKTRIDAATVLARDGIQQSGERGRPLRFDAQLRRAMKMETEMYFGTIMREDRRVVELIDSDYAFLNERLAKHYGLTNLNITGAQFRRVALPPDSPRGGVLTQGTILAVTSNPTRTSPVKRGRFILDNILGTPPPPPPPNIPALENSAEQVKDRAPTGREILALHRDKPLCSSCHNRMDPLGLAFENFNAMGMWRDREFEQRVDATGSLLTGESFTSIQELKHILATEHRVEFYRTLTEKLLVYALGRGLEFYDVQAVDVIVERLEKNDGRFSALLMGVVESAPFQKRRSQNRE